MLLFSKCFLQISIRFKMQMKQSMFHILLVTKIIEGVTLFYFKNNLYFLHGHTFFFGLIMVDVNTLMRGEYA